MSEISNKALAHLKQVVEWPDLSGTRYELVRELDRGGMGVVYAARDRDLGREVALKVLATSLCDPESAERLRNEARIIAGLEHPGIVPVHDVGGLPDGRVFYAMKLVSGPRLDSVVHSGRPLVERLRIFLKVCEPVAFAHAHAVIHRDLKPENVMVGPFGEVLVLDWGIAKRLGEGAPAAVEPNREAAVPTGTAPGTVLGTPAWMAPEQARGEVEGLDARTDVFALGAILHYLLTGRAPGGSAPGLSMAATRTWAGNASAPPRPVADLRKLERGIPRELAAICLKALAPRPEGRYASASELAADVALFLEGAAVSALPEGAWRKALRLAARHRTPILIVCAYVVMRAFLLWAFRV